MSILASPAEPHPAQHHSPQIAADPHQPHLDAHHATHQTEQVRRATAALLNSGLPYGLPDFRQLSPADYEAAIMAGVEQVRAEIKAITENPEPPTLSNTLTPLEAAGQLGATAWSIFHTLVWSDSTPEIEQLNARLSPIIAAFRSEHLTNQALFKRMSALENLPDLPADARYLLTRRLADMRRAGVLLTEAERLQLLSYDEELAALEAKFGQQLLATTNAGAVLVVDESELAGLTSEVKATFAAAAKERGTTGWLITLELPTAQSILMSLENRELRARIQAASEARGTVSGTDTRDTIVAIAKLRAERARLLGFENHAAYAASQAVAQSTAGIDKLLGQISGPAIESAKKAACALTELLRKDGYAGDLLASDWTYYADKQRRKSFQFNEEEVKPYLELTRVLESGVFYAANQLYGLTFVPRPDLTGYHPQVKVYEVFDGQHGEPNQGLGLILYDAYARPTKRGGAWMNALVGQTHLLGRKPIIAQNLNIVKPAPGQPTLLNWSQVTTMFHEFGHALHGLLSDVYYPSQSGTNVPRDFVEYPSQVNEMWALDPKIIKNYARHYLTDEVIPNRLIEQLTAALPSGEIFGTAEMAGAVALDQAWHRLTPEQVPNAAQVQEFEHRALAQAGVAYPPIPPRYRSTYYSHIFASGYSAAYYAYLFSEMFDADTEEWYHEHGGLTRENGERFRREVLSRGMTRDPEVSFRALRGRDVIIEPLLARRLITP